MIRVHRPAGRAGDIAAVVAQKKLPFVERIIVLVKHIAVAGAPVDIQRRHRTGSASDLTGIAPTLITCSELDPLRDEAVDYALRLMWAGVATELHVFPGTCHGFDSLVPTGRSASSCSHAGRRAAAGAAPQRLEGWRIVVGAAGIGPIVEVGELHLSRLTRLGTCGHERG